MSGSRDEYDLLSRALLDDQEAEADRKVGRTPRRSFDGRRDREKRKRAATAKAKRIGARSAQFNFTTFPDLKARFVALSQDHGLPLVEMMERAMRRFIDADEARKMAEERRARRGIEHA
jgi:hypothetical protein